MQLLIAPDTQQNIVYAVYFMVTHNFEAILYSGGMIAMAVWTLYKPTRWKLLIMLGFIILLFAFQYKKHIVDALVEQTRTSLITERQSWRLERYITIILSKLVPFALPVFGWFLIAVGAANKWLNWEAFIERKIKKS